MSVGEEGRCLTFYYHMYGENIGTLHVELDGGAGTSIVWTKSGNRDDR